MAGLHQRNWRRKRPHRGRPLAIALLAFLGTFILFAVGFMVVTYTMFSAVGDFGMNNADQRAVAQVAGGAAGRVAARRQQFEHEVAIGQQADGASGLRGVGHHESADMVAAHRLGRVPHRGARADPGRQRHRAPHQRHAQGRPHPRRLGRHVDAHPGDHDLPVAGGREGDRWGDDDEAEGGPDPRRTTDQPPGHRGRRRLPARDADLGRDRPMQGAGLPNLTKMLLMT